MNKSVYLIPFVPLIYGILMLNGIEVPRLGKDSGEFYIGSAISFWLLIPVMHYYQIKYDEKQKNKYIDKQVENIKDKQKENIFNKYLCYLSYISGGIYFICLIFFPISEIFLVIFLLGMFFCKISPKIYKPK